MNAVATAERGGGGAEETILETTEVQPGADESVADDLDEEVGEEADVTQVQKTLRDTTLGATTIGAPDAEGTRVQLGVEDTDMMDIDGEEYTEVSQA
jgi:condensin complex subunit 3